MRLLSAELIAFCPALMEVYSAFLDAFTIPDDTSPFPIPRVTMLVAVAGGGIVKDGTESVGAFPLVINRMMYPSERRTTSPIMRYGPAIPAVLSQFIFLYSLKNRYPWAYMASTRHRPATITRMKLDSLGINTNATAIPIIIMNTDGI